MKTGEHIVDLSRYRSDVPLLNEKVHNRRLVYFDNGATTQKPLAVLDAMQAYYLHQNANIHRGVHELSRKITEVYENVRCKVQQHIGAATPAEIVFTSGTTDSINLVAHGIGQTLKRGDEVLLTCMEHHSNILPWQHACSQKGAHLKVADITDEGEVNMDSFLSQLGERTRMVAFTHVSNTLGTINPVKEMTAHAHRAGALVLVDGAQAVPHMRPDMQELDVDFYAFSAHKMYGPTGIGILYGKQKALEDLPPYRQGGGIIKTVQFNKTEYADVPLRFEAGTPAIAEAVGLGAAIDYLNDMDWHHISSYENDLMTYAHELLSEIPEVIIKGTARQKTGVLSFIINNVHPLDAGTLLDHMGIAIRTGHHCTQPLMNRLGLSGTQRASFAWYNTREEISYFADSLKKVITMLK